MKKLFLIWLIQLSALSASSETWTPVEQVQWTEEALTRQTSVYYNTWNVLAEHFGTRPNVSRLQTYTTAEDSWVYIGQGYWEDPFWTWSSNNEPVNMDISIEKSVQHPNNYRAKILGNEYVTIFTKDPSKVYISPYSSTNTNDVVVTVTQNCPENGLSGSLYGTLSNGKITIPGNYFIASFLSTGETRTCDASRKCVNTFPDGFDNPLPEEDGVFMGIIAFNDKIARKQISLLNNDTKEDFTSFVDGLEMGDATLLYYAVDQAVNSMKAQTFPDNLSNAVLITFTDGLDQGSLAMNPEHRTSKGYASYLSDLIRKTTIQGHQLEAYAFGLMSDDVYDDELFMYNLQSLASSDDNKNISTVSNITDLQQKLSDLFENLNKQTTQRVVTIKVPMMSHGDKYRFTLDNSHNAKTSNIWFEGVFNIDNMSLENITYNGFTSTSGLTLTAKQEGIKILFTLNDCRDLDGNILDVDQDGIDQWVYIPSRGIWNHNDENAKAGDIDIQEIKSSVAIMFALDCSTSLGDDLFPLVKSTAKSFINRLAGGDENLIIHYTTSDSSHYVLDTRTQEASLAKYRGDTTEIIIPEFVIYKEKKYKVTNLESGSLGYQPFLKTVINEMTNVIKDESLFESTPISSSTLYVPKEMLATYKSTSPWNGFGTILPLLCLPDITIYLGGKSKISVNGVPKYAESKTLEWTSSNETVATVDTDGNVTAVGVGEAIITATATDGSGVSASCKVTAIMPDLGDSNANGTVNIADAVNTANHAVGNEVENFCFVAADVNADGEVTVADASGTVTIILAQPVQESKYDTRSLSALQPEGADCLTVSDYSAAAGETTTIGISLDNSIDYVALQADIVLPEGITLQSVVGGIRAAGHTLTTKRIDSRRVRVVLFNLGNSAFAANRESLLELKVRIEDINAGDIAIENIIASDASANEYRLVSTGGHSGMVTGMNNAPSDNVRVETADGSINVYNATGSAVTIYGTDGHVLARFVAKSAVERWQAATGVYVVAVGRNKAKVAVK